MSFSILPRLVAVAAIAVIAGCGSGGATTPKSGGASAVGSPIVNESSTRTTLASTISSASQQELPQLATTPGAQGAPVPGGLNPHGPVNITPVLYAENDDPGSMATLLPSTAIAQLANSAHEQNTRVTNVVLKHYMETQSYGAGVVSYAVHAKRMVYEVTGIITGPYTLGRHTWKSGTKIAILDAATGDVIGIRVVGTPISPSSNPAPIP